MDLSREINELVARFITRVTGLARELAHTQLVRALDGAVDRGGGSTANGARRAPAAGPRAIGGRRSPVEIERLRQRLLDHIAANPGQRIEEIKVALDASTPELAVPLQKLIYADLVRTEGERRATRYFPAAAPEARRRTPRPKPAPARERKRPADEAPAEAAADDAGQPVERTAEPAADATAPAE